MTTKLTGLWKFARDNAGQKRLWNLRGQFIGHTTLGRMPGIGLREASAFKDLRLDLSELTARQVRAMVETKFKSPASREIVKQIEQNVTGELSDLQTDFALLIKLLDDTADLLEQLGLKSSKIGEGVKTKIQLTIGALQTELEDYYLTREQIKPLSDKLVNLETAIRKFKTSDPSDLFEGIQAIKGLEEFVREYTNKDRPFNDSFRKIGLKSVWDQKSLTNARRAVERQTGIVVPYTIIDGQSRFTDEEAEWILMTPGHGLQSIWNNVFNKENLTIDQGIRTHAKNEGQPVEVIIERNEVTPSSFKVLVPALWYSDTSLPFARFDLREIANQKDSPEKEAQREKEFRKTVDIVVYSINRRS